MAANRPIAEIIQQTLETISKSQKLLERTEELLKKSRQLISLKHPAPWDREAAQKPSVLPKK